MKWLPLGLFGLIFLLFGAGLFLLKNDDHMALPSPLVGKEVPAFSVPVVTDSLTMLSEGDLKGQPSLFVIWATWCVSCIEEHSTLLAIARENVLPLYGLNYKDEIITAQRFLKEAGNPFVKTGIDVTGKVGIDWGVYGTPETYLIDKNGFIVYKHVGPLTYTLWQEVFKPKILALRVK